jgi:hypothetical protein
MHSTSAFLAETSNDKGSKQNSKGTAPLMTTTTSYTRKPREKQTTKPLTKHIGKISVGTVNYKFRRKQSRKKVEKGFINLNIAALNCHSISNKALSIREILKGQNLDFAFCSELHIRDKAPGFQGYKSFVRKSERKFHGIACYTRKSVHEYILRIPEEDKELKIIHLLVKNTVPNTNIIGVCLDCKKDAIKTEHVWTKLVGKLETALRRGKEVILIGDFNRPLQAPIPSHGTKLLLDWEQTGQVKILNNKNVHTRIDPATKKGSTLDLGVISINLKPRITEFKVDTEKEWTPYSMGKRSKRVTKRFSDHLGIKMSVRLKKIPDECRPNKEVINYKNTEGCYRQHS